MKIAYFDCFSGISGDMCLGALAGAGVDWDWLKGELAKLPVEGYGMRMEKVTHNGISATNVFVDLLEVEQPERHLADIFQIIDDSLLPVEVKEKSKAVFGRLAAAEAAVHCTTPDHVHFHEVGAVDAIVDVVGTVLGLGMLGADRIPATLEILRGVPVYGAEIEGELVTPTGAALIATLAEAFTGLPPLVIEKTGYGAGKRKMERPNLLRLIVGEAAG